MDFPKLKFHKGGDDWETYNAMDPTKKYQYRDVYKGQQLERADEQLPETMTSRLIFIAVLSVLVMILTWFMLGLAQFGGLAFAGSVSDAASNSSQIVSQVDNNSGSGSGDVSDSDLSASGLDGSGNYQTGEDLRASVEPKSLEEFRMLQSMGFDTYLATYYKMAEDNGMLHKYLSSITGDMYDWIDVYMLYEEITKDNYAAYLAMYNGSSDKSWQDGSDSNYIASDVGVENSENSDGSSTSDSSSSDTVGGLTIKGVSLSYCVKKVSFWKIFVTLLAGLLTWAIMYPIMKRNLEVQNQGKDNRHLLQYPNDQHIQMPEEVQRGYDYFPDVGAHAPVQVASMISHVMLLNKGVKTVPVARRADSDILSEDGEIMYHKGEMLLDDDGNPIFDEMPMFDKKFGIALFTAAKVLDDKRARVFYNPAKIPYNPKNENRDKLKDAATVAEMINKYWSFPEYEPQRPAGAYLVDTAPVNTMV